MRLLSFRSIEVRQIKNDIRGWYSRYYGEKKECLDIRFDIETNGAAEFKTVFFQSLKEVYYAHIADASDFL